MAIPHVKLITAVVLAIVVTAIVYWGERSTARHAERAYGMPPSPGPGVASSIKWFLITFGTTFAVLHFFLRPDSCAGAGAGAGGDKGGGKGRRAMSGGGGDALDVSGAALDAYSDMLMNIDMEPPPF